MSTKLGDKYERINLRQFIFIGLLPSFLKTIYYKSKGYKIGKNVNFSFGSVLNCDKSCYINNNVKFGLFSYIKCNSIKIESNSELRSFTFLDVPEIYIGENVIISEMVIIRAQQPCQLSKIFIDNRVHIFPNSLIDPSYPISIGEESAVGFNCAIFTHGAYKNILEGYKVTHQAVNIGKRVELTYNVFISPGSNIGDDVIVAYGSYVNSDLPSGVLAAGLPAKVKREKKDLAHKLSEEEKKVIIIDIIMNFVDYLSYRYNLTIEKNENQWTIYYKNKVNNIYFIENLEFIKFERKSIIITLLSTNKIIDIIQKSNNIFWFNCKDYICYGKLDNISKELRNYFERYGIRFSYYE